MNEIVVLDHSDSTVHIYLVKLSTNEEIEAFLESKGHHLSECSYMFGSNIQAFSHCD